MTGNRSSLSPTSTGRICLSATVRIIGMESNRPKSLLLSCPLDGEAYDRICAGKAVVHPVEQQTLTAIPVHRILYREAP